MCSASLFVDVFVELLKQHSIMSIKWQIHGQICRFLCRFFFSFLAPIPALYTQTDLNFSIKNQFIHEWNCDERNLQFGVPIKAEALIRRQNLHNRLCCSEKFKSNSHVLAQALSTRKETATFWHFAWSNFWYQIPIWGSDWLDWRLEAKNCLASLLPAMDFVVQILFISNKVQWNLRILVPLRNSLANHRFSCYLAACAAQQQRPKKWK